MEGKDRVFLQEIEKSKHTVNKLIEDNIRDKQKLDTQDREAHEKDKQLRKMQRIVEDKELAI